jgi:bifunctional UDP-N-acetylglucosamine pyrophosphorylase/glucosamine-1-phosphate N-acetyltransferase
MRSSLPKVLHPLANKPLLQHVVETATTLDPESIHVVYGHGGEQVQQQLSSLPVSWVLQAEQLGTGHAVEQALPALQQEALVLVLYGDVPLIETETLKTLLQAAGQSGFGLLTVSLQDPNGYGRIVRDSHGSVARIVEQKDATEAELQINEVNTGIMALSTAKLKQWIGALENDNAQREFYLTDIVEMAVADGVEVVAVNAPTEAEVQGVNDRLQLAQLERAYQRQQAERLMRAGVTLMDPQRFDLRGTLQCEQDVTIDINVIIEGDVKLGEGVRVGANCHLKDTVVAAGTEILSNCVIESAKVGAECRIGPFARIRPGTELVGLNHIGNFVEIKNSRVDSSSKINHLAYVGDSTVGRRVNIGAGVITCNYDGANKHRTVIGDGAFIGSDSQLVAPVEVEAGATIGAGSTIAKTAPADQLTLSRSKQVTIKGWKRPIKEQ